MKKTGVLFALFMAGLMLCSCMSQGITQKVQSWFSVPTKSSISYNLDGVTGEAEFTYHTENNNTIQFTSGESLEGVTIAFHDGKVTASRPQDGLSWEIDPDTTEILSMFGKLYNLSASLSYTFSPPGEKGEDIMKNTFEYLDGKYDVYFSKKDGRPALLSYTQGGQTIEIEIKEIEIIEE
ncbi:MAG: hypothetical protein IJO74_04730 [Clostridia bacterium]|nr:hypothetical protein [Clostridia bacterium]